MIGVIFSIIISVRSKFKFPVVLKTLTRSPFSTSFISVLFVITSCGLEDSPVAFGADFISVLFVITSCGAEDSSAAFGGSFSLFPKISLIFSVNSQHPNSQFFELVLELN